MKRLLPVFAVLPLASPAAAGSSLLIGRWQQIRSTGGECPTCALAVTGGNDRLAVMASNGWTAELAPLGNSEAAAVGTGRWPDWNGAAVQVLIAVGDDGNLVMRMVIRHPDGHDQAVRAVFRRGAPV